MRARVLRGRCGADIGCKYDAGPSAARVRIRVWVRERLRELRVSRHARCPRGRMGSVDAFVPSLKRPNTPMSDNLLKMRIHFAQNACLMQNIFIRCVFYPCFYRLSDLDVFA